MKKSLTIILVIIMVSALFFSSAGAIDVSKTKKHVAMVYDDSTSMYQSDKTQKPVLNWSYANYMTQAFLALLNPHDSLYITYMSDTEKEDVSYSNLMEKDKVQAIEAVREKNDYINKTPIKAVETAYNMLKVLDESDTDEYWLVILTDGEFTDYSGDITQMLINYIDEMAALNKTLKVVFLAIGENAQPPDANQDKGLIVYQTGTDEIVSTMAALADNISGRHNVSSDRMSELSGNRVSVDMLLPVRSLIVFTQADGNTLNEVSNNKDDAMSVESEIAIGAPDEFEFLNDITAQTDETAIGTIARVVPGVEGAILSDGRYVLSFNSDVNLDNIRVMYEPALDIQIRYRQNGRAVTNPEDGTLCDIEVVLVNALTGSALNSKVLPEEVLCTIQIVSDGKVIDTRDGFTIEDVEFKSGNLSINTEINMPGYFILRSRQDYIYNEQPEATPTTTPAEYDDSQGPWPPEITLLVQVPGGSDIALKDLQESEPIYIIPLFNGEKGQLNDLQMGSLQLIYSRQIEFETQIDEAYMGFVIYPKYSNDIYSTSTGAISINAIFQSEYGKTGEAMILLNVKDLSWIQRNYRIIAIPLAALVLVILILGIMVFKKKFAKGTWIELTQMHKNLSGDWVASKAPASVSLNNLKGKWKMVPFAPERLKISNLTFYPSVDDQNIIIKKASLKPNMGTTKGPLEKSDLKTDFYLQTGYRFYIETGENRLVFVYHAPKKTLLTKTKKKSKKR